MADKPAAITGDFATYKHIPSRKVVQLVIEVPQEAQEAMFQALGYPVSGETVPVAVARLKDDVAKPQKERRNWHELSAAQQAGIRCSEKSFQRFTHEMHGWPASEENAAECVRQYCGVKSRSELDEMPGATNAWNSLDHQFQNWLRT